MTQLILIFNMKISFETYGDTFTFEAKDDDFTSSEVVEKFADLMMASGYSKVTIYNAFRYWMDENEKIKEEADNYYKNFN